MLCVAWHCVRDERGVCQVMDSGRVVERGNHEELLARGGRYASMWALQDSERIPPVEKGFGSDAEDLTDAEESEGEEEGSARFGGGGQPGGASVNGVPAQEQGARPLVAAGGGNGASVRAREESESVPLTREFLVESEYVRGAEAIARDEERVEEVRVHERDPLVVESDTEEEAAQHKGHAQRSISTQD